MDRIVALALRQRVLIVVALALLVIAGLTAFINLNIEAYPDPVPPMVDVVTQNPGQSADEIERYITIPIEIQMAGIPFCHRDPYDFGVRPVRYQHPVHLRFYL